MHNATDRRSSQKPARTTGTLLAATAAMVVTLASLVACAQTPPREPWKPRSATTQPSTTKSSSTDPATKPTPAAPRLPGQWQSIPATDPRAANIPSTPREFRGLWVATVDNIDWPSTKNLSSSQQQAEIIQILDRAKSLNFNAIVLQVRPTCDAIYPSTIEPWSEFLTGRSGQPPNPPYDPLKVWIDAAHARGIQLHAWINPFRARHPKTQFQDAASHVSKTNPAMVKKYGEYLWLDPGEPWVQDRSIAVVRDLVSRYDLDGIHIDDYFYPYPIAKIDFDDRSSFSRYQSTGGTLPRDAWRRANVDRFVERLYREVKNLKREALVGISPFGIWRPGNPPGITSMDPYVQLHADSKKWLQQGWLDYFAPQLYWPIESKGQPFEPLLKWWVQQNTQRRHLWPGIYTSRVGSKEGKSYNATEISRQVDLVRRTPGAGGVVHFSAISLMENRPGLNDALRRTYASPAIVPASPWLSTTAPAAPTVTATRSGDSLSLAFSAVTGPVKPFRYVIGREYAPGSASGSWQCVILPGDATITSIPATSATSPAAPLRRVVVSAVDRLGNESARVVLIP